MKYIKVLGICLKVRKEMGWLKKENILVDHQRY